MRMPYELVALVAAIVLGFRHVFLSQAVAASKVAVGLAVLASLVIWWQYPQWLLVATLLQVAVGFYVLLYARVAQLR